MAHEASTPQTDFNLQSGRWIPVLRANGKPERVGIRPALVKAGAILQLAASNPMENVALLRFLLAVLMCRSNVRLGGAACNPA